MIDAVIIDSLGPEEQLLVQQALANLSLSGVFDSQVKLEQDRLFSGDNEEPVIELAKKIRNTRTRVGELLNLKAMGLQFAKELGL